MDKGASTKKEELNAEDKKDKKTGRSPIELKGTLCQRMTCEHREVPNLFVVLP